MSTFEVHSKKMGDAAIDLAKAGGVMDKKTVDDIIRTSEKVWGLWTVIITIHI